MIPAEIPSVIDSIRNQLRTPSELATQHKELPHIMLAEVATGNILAHCTSAGPGLELHNLEHNELAGAMRIILA